MPSTTTIANTSRIHAVARGAMSEPANGAAPLRGARSAVHNTTVSASAPGHSRFLQSRGYEIAGTDPRIMSCGTVPVLRSGICGVSLTDSAHVQVAGLQRCGKRFCPSCAHKIGGTRAAEIDHVCRWALSEGFTLAFMTLTAGHVTENALKLCGGDHHKALLLQSTTDLFARIRLAWRYATSGRGGKELRRLQIGYARSTELTVPLLTSPGPHTGNHLHFHVLLVLKPGTSVDDYGKKFFENWRNGCARAGLRASIKGFDIERVYNDSVEQVAKYLVKGEKQANVALEMTMQAKKQASKQRTTPEGLLRTIARLADEQNYSPTVRRLIAQFRDIEEGCRGIRWLTWSRDLRKLASMGEEKSDEEIVHEVQGTLTGEVLEVKARDLLPHLETVKEVVHGVPEDERWETLVMCLQSFGISYRCTTEADFREKVANSYRALRGDWIPEEPEKKENMQAKQLALL